MSVYVYPKKLDLDSNRVFFEEEFAKKNGINKGDVVILYLRDGEVGAIAEFTTSLVKPGEVGVPAKIWTKYRFPDNLLVLVENLHQAESVKYIRKKLQGHKLSYDEVFSILDDIVHYRLTPVEMTYFASAGHCPGFDKEEIFYLTKAMVETGDRIDFSDQGDLVVDKHSIGGVPNKAVTPVLVPILAEMGFVVPNTFSRAITTPAGTGDIVEVVMPVTLSVEKIKETVKNVGAVLAWGGAIDLAPADDILIQIERPLAMESYDKFVVSIMAKKISMGIKYLLIDIPYGEFGKIPQEDVEEVSNMFKELGEKFGVKVDVLARESFGSDGYGIGPVLEIRDVLRILERNEVRPLHVENLVLEMAARLGVLTGVYESHEDALITARQILDSGRALEKFWQIASAQGATERVASYQLTPGAYQQQLVWKGKEVTVKAFNRRLLVEVARTLGAPLDKGAGLDLQVFVGDTVKQGMPWVTLYAETPLRLKTTLERFKGKFQDIIVS